MSIDEAGPWMFAVGLAVVAAAVVGSMTVHAFWFDCEDEFNKNRSTCSEYRSTAEAYEACLTKAQERMAACLE